MMRTRQPRLEVLSEVALMKRLRKSGDWPYALCVELFREHGVTVSSDGGFQARAFDATMVQKLGRTGSFWVLHYSVNLSSLSCDFFKVTGTEGPGVGESFRQFPIRPGDYVLADRAYSNANGIQYVAAAEGPRTRRWEPGSISVLSPVIANPLQV